MIWIDMIRYWLVLSGWKRSLTYKKLKLVLAGKPEIEDFPGFDILKLHRAIAWDADSSLHIIEQLNIGNKMGLGMTILDKVFKTKEPFGKNPNCY